MASPLTLRDDFQDNIIASAWAAGAVSGSATRTETSGQARFTLPSSVAGTHSAYHRTPVSYDFTAASFYINIETMVATGVAATAFFDVFLDGSNVLRWRQLSNTISARSIVSGVETQEFSATWNATTYKYLRIREGGGSILWESSTDGETWTNRATLANPFLVTALFIQFGASCGNIASPGSLRLDDVNLVRPTLATNWNWTQVRWPVDVVHRNVTAAIDQFNTGQGYVVTADGVDVSNAPSGGVRYWSGPASDGRTLTEQASQAAAEAMAVNIPSDGRFDLPELVQCRCVRVYHRSMDGVAYTIRELYPRRLVQADDIEAEAVRALHISAGSINADHINAVLDITGKLIRTAYSGARVVLSGDTNGGFVGYGSTDTYDPSTGTGTYQVLWKLTDGKFYAGTGNVVIGSDGIVFSTGTYLTWASAVNVGYSGSNWSLTAVGKTISIGTTGGTGITIATESNAPVDINAPVTVGSATGGVAGDISLSGGLNVGTATGAAAGEINTSGTITANPSASLPTLIVDRNSGIASIRAGTGATNNALIMDGNGGGAFLNNYVSDDLFLNVGGGNIAFFGAMSAGGGAEVIFIGNRTTAPSSNPSGGGILYAESGALKWRGSGGTVTTIANA